MKKILKLFGYYHFTDINQIASEVKKVEDKKMWALSQRIQRLPYIHGDESVIEAGAIATEVASTNPVGEFVVDLVNS